MAVHAAALRIELYLRDCRSLKAKRATLRPVIEGMSKRHRVSVSEVDHHDNWHLATVGVAAVAPSHAHLRAWIDRVRAQPGFLDETFPYSIDPHSTLDL